ncbi:MAG TPA: c-type cytochrome [Methylomirabilota bacterium]|nr:c-type cytochrome [Methylomirabilota bacterium]
MTTIRFAAALAAAVFVLAVAPGAARAAGPLDDPGFAKVITCAACHGWNGNSGSDMMPSISGLDPAYFKRQTENYATGKRPSPEMEPYAKEIQFLGLDQIAAYFAAQKRLPTPIRSSAEAAARGKTVAAQCVICHGPDGKGDPARLIPGLAGQPPGYLAQQMVLFKVDTRDPGEPLLAAKKALMRIIPDGQFADLAAYYSSLR